MTCIKERANPWFPDPIMHSLVLLASPFYNGGCVLSSVIQRFNGWAGCVAEFEDFTACLVAERRFWTFCCRFRETFLPKPHS